MNMRFSTQVCAKTTKVEQNMRELYMGDKMRSSAAVNGGHLENNTIFVL